MAIGSLPYPGGRSDRRSRPSTSSTVAGVVVSTNADVAWRFLQFAIIAGAADIGPFAAVNDIKIDGAEPTGCPRGKRGHRLGILPSTVMKTE